MNGVDYMGLDAQSTVDLLWACVVDDLTSVGASRQEVRDEMNKKLAEVTLMHNARLIKQASDAKAAGKPLAVGVPQAQPFALTPQMQQALGLHVKKPTPDGGSE
jgi:hypothetical protein